MAGKTSALFQLSTKSAAILSNASEDQINNIDKFAYYLGLAFQIVDDILDYTGSESDVGKPVGADLRQGTLTLPASMLMERYPDDNPVIEIFNHRDVEENIKKAVQMVRDSDIIEKCYAEAERFVNKALEYLYKLPDNKYRDGLEALSRYVIERRK
jgi:geranylgeranyl pyrophosphate synthase